MFARVLNMPLDYLSSFAVVLRGIHWKIGICQTDYNIHSKLRIFPYSEVIHGSTTFKLMKGKQRLKKNDQLINLMFFPFFLFLHFNVPDNVPDKCHKQKWHMLFLPAFSSGACTGVCPCDHTHHQTY